MICFRRETIAVSYWPDETCAWLSPALSLALAIKAKRLFWIVSFGYLKCAARLSVICMRRTF